MFLKMSLLATLSIFVLVGSTFAQGTGIDRLKQDVGSWDAEVRMFEPGTEQPTVSKGSEHNYMLGDKWLVSHFKGELAGMPFEGASYTGYNEETQKYFGNWIDSMSDSPMAIEGTWDENSQTLNYIGVSKGPDGSDMKLKMITVYNKDNSRLWTMSMIGPDNSEMKMMEIHYTKAKVQHHESAPAGV